VACLADTGLRGSSIPTFFAIQPWNISAACVLILWEHRGDRPCEGHPEGRRHVTRRPGNAL